MGTYPPYYAYPSAPPVVRVVPDPPRLHWAVLLILTICTLGLFSSAWMIVQCVWVRKVYGRSKALPWAIAYACILPGFFLFAFALGIVGAIMHLRNTQELLAISVTFVRILIFLLWIAAVFTLRGELEGAPIGIPLHGGMTFFFGPVYFQYHLYDYKVPDEVHLFRGPLRTELELPPAKTESGA